MPTSRTTAILLTRSKTGGARFSVHRIFFSHLHLDHVLGLPGFLGTMGLLGRSEPLRLYGPLGSRQYIQMLTGLFLAPWMVMYALSTLVMAHNE